MRTPGTCVDCGAKLRRANATAEHCDQCRRRRSREDPLGALRPDFVDSTPELRPALMRYDFGLVFRAVRTELGISQPRLCDLLGLMPGTVGDVERGKRTLRDIALVARVAQRLHIPPVALGFPRDSPTTVGGGGLGAFSGEDGMYRRDFVNGIMAITLAASTAGIDVQRLLSLLPQSADPMGRQIGAADVDTINATTRALTQQDFAHGSGPVRDAAIDQLRIALPLLDARMDDRLRPELMVAVAELALLAGWLSFDSRRHGAAQRFWTIATDVAQHSGHPQRHDLVSYLIFDMLLQAVHLRRTDDAIRLVRIGRAASVGSADLSPATASVLASAEARAHALTGDGRACERALGEAEDLFSRADATASPRWSVYHCQDSVGLFGHHGAARYELARTTADRATGRAVSDLSAAVDRFGADPKYVSRKAVYLPDLAGAHALAGDLDTAVALGHEAADSAATVSSPRIHDKLHHLRATLEPVAARSDVADLRHRLATTTV